MIIDGSVSTNHLYSLDEYFELEKSKNEKFEFWNGRVWSDSGENYSHNVIAQNLLIGVDQKLPRREAEVLPSTMRIKVPSYPPYRYPDLSVLCGEAQIDEIGGIEMLVNPRLIIEILSDSTEAYDRGDKFSYYKSIPSFSEYLLIAQHRPHFTQFVKHGDGFWANYEYNDLADVVESRSVGCSLPLTAIYRGVSFPEPNLSGSGTGQSRE